MAEASLPLFPLPIVSRALSFFLPSPSLPSTQRGFCGGERGVDYWQAVQAQCESFIINACGFILRNPWNGREHRGFVWKFRYKIQEDKYSLEFSTKHILPYLLHLFLLARERFFFPIHYDFSHFLYPRVSTLSERTRLYIPVRNTRYERRKMLSWKCSSSHKSNAESKPICPCFISLH